MAYTNPFPASYQPIYYPQQLQQLQQYQQFSQPQIQPNSNQQSNSSIIWVQGEAGAKSYMVLPNTTVQLWDSESQVIYLKSADASGMPSMKVLDYTIRDSSTPQQTPQVMENKVDYVTREELNEFESRINQRFDKLSFGKNRRERKEDEQSSV